MQLFVPACGDRIVLTRAWKFELTLEHRNINFAKEHGLVDSEPHRWNHWGRSSGYKRVEVTIPKGTMLECDRVYIRVFSKNKAHDDVDNDFDSLTWRIVGKNGKAKMKDRFWAKLSDCNRINFKLEADSKFRDRVKAPREVLEA